jgi:lysophospholipase L1-like esterase
MRTPLLPTAALAAAVLSLTAAAAPPPESPNVHPGGLANARIEFEQNGRGHVAFIGGSITEMQGYRPMVVEILRRRFPRTEFTVTDAGISSTCSATGAFRLERDVLSKGPVDLFFIEFAVNDDQDAAHARRECIRGMEGIVRHVRRHNPAADVVVTYFVNPPMLETLTGGGVPVSIAAHDEVARHYGVSTIHLAREVAERIAAGSLTWAEYGGTHPKPAGNAVCARMIDELFSRAWKDPLAADARKQPHAMPQPLDAGSYADGRLVDPGEARLGGGWSIGVPDWKSLKGQCRSRFAEVPLLVATEPGAELTLAFHGRAIGAYLLAGPDAGVLEASIDGGPFRAFDLLHRFSSNLHYPRTVIFNADLAPGEHALVLRVADEKNSASTGHAERILAFVAN